jgi:farnesyl-diphosphate farnesyltransferase
MEQLEDTADRAFCAEMLPHVSRTFALSIAALPDDLRHPIEVAYLLCRIADTVEDDAHLEPRVRLQMFDAFDDALGPEGTPTDAARIERLAHEHDLGTGESHRLCLGSRHVFRCFHALSPAQRSAIRPHVAELARGMREVRRIDNVDDLERYCYFVAGTVGKLLTALFEQSVPSLDETTKGALRARAVAFGTGLQLVNIVKDVAEDFERGECFVPTEMAARHGIPLAELLEPRHREAAMRVVHELCALAREHLRHARAYTLLWPPDEGSEIRMFCAVPLALALATLKEVESGKDTLVRGATPKVTRELVGDVIDRARRAVGSDVELAAMFDSLSGATS